MVVSKINHTRLVHYPVIKSANLGRARVLFFFTIVLILFLGIFSVAYSWKKVDNTERFSIFNYIKEKLGSVNVK